MKNDVELADWERAKNFANMILVAYGVPKRYYLSEQGEYNKLVENIAAAIDTAYDNGYAAGTAKA